MSILVKILEPAEVGYVLRDQFTILNDVAPDFVEVPVGWKVGENAPQETRFYKHWLDVLDGAAYYIPTEIYDDPSEPEFHP